MTLEEFVLFVPRYYFAWTFVVASAIMACFILSLEGWVIIKYGIKKCSIEISINAVLMLTMITFTCAHDTLRGGLLAYALHYDNILTPSILERLPEQKQRIIIKNIQNFCVTHDCNHQYHQAIKTVPYLQKQEEERWKNIQDMPKLAAVLMIVIMMISTTKIEKARRKQSLLWYHSYVALMLCTFMLVSLVCAFSLTALS